MDRVEFISKLITIPILGKMRVTFCVIKLNKKYITKYITIVTTLHTNISKSTAFSLAFLFSFMIVLSETHLGCH